MSSASSASSSTASSAASSRSTSPQRDVTQAEHVASRPPNVGLIATTSRSGSPTTEIPRQVPMSASLDGSNAVSPIDDEPAVKRSIPERLSHGQEPLRTASAPSTSMGSLDDSHRQGAATMPTSPEEAPQKSHHKTYQAPPAPIMSGVPNRLQDLSSFTRHHHMHGPTSPLGASFSQPSSLAAAAANYPTQPQQQHLPSLAHQFYQPPIDGDALDQAKTDTAPPGFPPTPISMTRQITFGHLPPSLQQQQKQRQHRALKEKRRHERGEKLKRGAWYHKVWHYLYCEPLWHATTSPIAPSKALPPTLPDWRHALYAFVEDPSSSRLAFTFAIFTLLMILFSVALMVVESLPQYYTREAAIWIALETFIVSFFSAELLARALAHAYAWRPFFKWAITFTTIVDVLAILPYFLTVAIAGHWEVQSFTILRLFRLVRIFRVFRYFSLTQLSIDVLAVAIKKSLAALGAMLVFLFMCIIFYSTIIWYCERGSWSDADQQFLLSDGSSSPFQSIPDAAWYVATTITTTGYGDKTPITVMGRIVGALCMITGILLIALPSIILGRNFTGVWEATMRYRQRHGRLESLSRTDSFQPIPITSPISTLDPLQLDPNQLTITRWPTAGTKTARTASRDTSDASGRSTALEGEAAARQRVAPQATARVDPTPRPMDASQQSRVSQSAPDPSHLAQAMSLDYAGQAPPEIARQLLTDLKARIALLEQLLGLPLPPQSLEDHVEQVMFERRGQTLF